MSFPPRKSALDHVVALARALQVTHGRKLRIDGTVVATHIQHPTDSTLLYDGVRGLSRTLGNAKQVLQATPAVAHQVFRERPRRAKRQRKRIMEAAHQRGPEAADRMQTAYQHLCDIPMATVQQAMHVGALCTAPATQRGQKLAAPFEPVIPLVRQVVAQTTRRVCQGEAVPASDKLVRLFAPPRRLPVKARQDAPPSSAGGSGGMRARAAS